MQKSIWLTLIIGIRCLLLLKTNRILRAFILLWETYSESCVYFLLSPEIPGRTYKYNPQKTHSHTSSQLQTPGVCRAWLNSTLSSMWFTLEMVHAVDAQLEGPISAGCFSHSYAFSKSSSEILLSSAGSPHS